MKPQKPLSINSPSEKTIKEIKNLESQLRGLLKPAPGDRWINQINDIKKELNRLYRLRKKQKNFKPIPTKTKKKGF